MADYGETMTAMTTIGMTEEEQSSIIQTVAAILHLGNIMFTEEGNDKAVVEDQDCKDTNLRSIKLFWSQDLFVSNIRLNPKPRTLWFREVEFPIRSDALPN